MLESTVLDSEGSLTSHSLSCDSLLPSATDIVVLHFLNTSGTYPCLDLFYLILPSPLSVIKVSLHSDLVSKTSASCVFRLYYCSYWLSLAQRVVPCGETQTGMFAYLHLHFVCSD